jgi:hypothetical protein
MIYAIIGFLIATNIITLYYLIQLKIENEALLQFTTDLLETLHEYEKEQ